MVTGVLSAGSKCECFFCVCVFVCARAGQFMEQSSPSVSVSVSEHAVSMATWAGLTMTARRCSSSALALLS